ncbi:multiple inositol polyphosphate phosphatase 1-like isoform X2 [Planococcus citri]|uniref:multiple inositol polyphosphate phosphatase 1-like isoform X2 n=1 Tax=Planococcus citri TaxID=170843 RepID=UPI0031F80428
MMALNFLILVLMMLSILSTKASKQCYAEMESPYVYFAAMTSYSAGRGSQMNVPENCEPVYLWGLIRHGTRYPEIEVINSMDKLYVLRDEIILNHKKERGNLCEKDILNLGKWSSNLPAGVVSEGLAPQGVKDQIFLAQKMKEIFPKLFESPTKDDIMFQSSGQSRTRDSAIAFSNELTGSNFTTSEGNNITENPELLQLAEHCPRYVKEVEQNSSTYMEVNLFKKTAYFQKIIAEISIRLGYIQSLSFDSILLMYNVCAYENAWDPGSRPPFCAAFLPDELKVFEYLYDMNRYYKRGYGSRFVNQLGCPVVQDMMQSLLYANQKLSKTHKGKFLFSHMETIIPTTVKLGLYKDEEPLRHDNYQKMIKKRKWRLAQFDPFAANIIAVLYKCFNQTKVVIYQNERPSVFPQCNNSSFCSLEILQRMFSDVFNKDECNTEFCQLHSEKVFSAYSDFLNPIILAIIFLIITYFLRCRYL